MTKDIVIELQHLGDSTPHNQGRSTIYAAISEIERLRAAIDEFYVAEREYSIAINHPESFSEGEKSYAIKAYNIAVGKLRRMVITNHAE